MGVVEARSFTRAGEQLHLVQSGVSKAIGRLEQELGLSLLERRRDGALPTAHGRALAVHAQAIIAAVDHAEALMALRRDEIRGRVVVGILPTITPLVLEGLLRRLHRRLPHVTVDVREAGVDVLDEALARGELDVTVTWSEGPAPATDAEQMVSLPLVAALPAAHRLAGRLATLDDLAAEHWVAFTAGGPGRRWLSELASRGGFEPCIALLPAGAVAVEVRSGALVTIEIPAPAPRVWLAWAAEPRRQDGTIDGVRAALREIFELLASGEEIIAVGDLAIADGRLRASTSGPTVVS